MDAIAAMRERLFKEPYERLEIELKPVIRRIYRGAFKGKKIVNNQISAHAVRLAANCIVVYNAIILNTVYEKMLAEGASQAIIDEFARI